MARFVFGLLVASVVPVGVASGQTTPRVRLFYPTILERECSNFTKTELDPAWVQEASGRIPELQALWDSAGQRYLATAIAETGLPFPYLEVQAYATVCPLGLNAMSTPLLMDLRPFLQSTAALPGPRWPTWFFAEVLFHELLHHYVLPVQQVSVLRQKYSTESTVTRNHLHVMALEKAVLTKLGLTSELAFVDKAYRSNSGPAYKRAWEIVSDIEGERPFLNEFRLAASTK